VLAMRRCRCVRSRCLAVHSVEDVDAVSDEARLEWQGHRILLDTRLLPPERVLVGTTVHVVGEVRR
jgi:hypothetical protein